MVVRLFKHREIVENHRSHKCQSKATPNEWTNKQTENETTEREWIRGDNIASKKEKTKWYEIGMYGASTWEIWRQKWKRRCRLTTTDRQYDVVSNEYNGMCHYSNIQFEQCRANAVHHIITRSFGTISPLHCATQIQFLFYVCAVLLFNFHCFKRQFTLFIIWFLIWNICNYFQRRTSNMNMSWIELALCMYPFDFSLP